VPYSVHMNARTLLKSKGQKSRPKWVRFSPATEAEIRKIQIQEDRSFSNAVQRLVDEALEARREKVA
jgi:hypothetical protein